MEQRLPLMIVHRAIVVHGLSTLLIERAMTSSNNRGLWELPGGKEEPSLRETPEAAIRREIAEETGLSVDFAILPRFHHSYTIEDGKYLGTRVEVVASLAIAHSYLVDLTHSPEHTEALWVPSSTAHEQPNLTGVSRLILSDPSLRLP